MQTNSGIYAITNRNNGKQYIGSAVDMRTRARVHLHHLRHGSHHSVKLQRAFNKHGEAAFLFRPLIVCAPRDLLMYEQRAIDALGVVGSGYNVLPTAGSSLGVKRTEQFKARLSAATRGHKRSTAHLYTAEVRAKMSASQKKLAQLCARPRTSTGQFAPKAGA